MWSKKIKNNQDVLSWEQASVRLKSNNKPILYDVSGRALSGRIMAVMGPSGSGKTTLLNEISGSMTLEMESTSNVYYNGRSLPLPADRLSLISYKNQNSPRFTHLTLYESLSLMWSKENGDGKKGKMETILQYIDDFNLGGSENKYLADLSGGMMERVNIIKTILSANKILVFDEALSKLDSYVTKVAMDLICREVKKNKIVIMSLHQPSQEIEEKIDDLILVSQGKMVYHGEYSKIRKYYRSMGYTMTDNYQQEMIDLIISDVDSRSLDEQENNLRIKNLHNNFKPDYIESLISKKDVKMEKQFDNVIPVQLLLHYFFLENYRRFIGNIRIIMNFGFFFLFWIFSNCFSLISYTLQYSSSSSKMFSFLKYFLLLKIRVLMKYLNLVILKDYIDKSVNTETALYLLFENCIDHDKIVKNHRQIEFIPIIYDVVMRFFKLSIFKLFFMGSSNSFEMLIHLYKSGKIRFYAVFFICYLLICSLNLLTIPLFDLFGMATFVRNCKTTTLYSVLPIYCVAIISTACYLPTYLLAPLNKILFPTTNISMGNKTLVKVGKYSLCLLARYFHFTLNGVVDFKDVKGTYIIFLVFVAFIIMPEMGWYSVIERMYVYDFRSFAITLGFEGLDSVFYIGAFIAELAFMGILSK